MLATSLTPLIFGDGDLFGPDDELLTPQAPLNSPDPVFAATCVAVVKYASFFVW
jgi:hypothetical protein